MDVPISCQYFSEDNKQLSTLCILIQAPFIHCRNNYHVFIISFYFPHNYQFKVPWIQKKTSVPLLDDTRWKTNIFHSDKSTNTLCSKFICTELNFIEWKKTWIIKCRK